MLFRNTFQRSPYVLTYNYQKGVKRRLLSVRTRALLAVAMPVMLVMAMGVPIKYSTFGKSQLSAMGPQATVYAAARPIPKVVPVIEPQPAVAVPTAAIKAQQILDEWAAKHGGETWGVAIENTGSDPWKASVNGGKAFNSDSLYKLFVAYLAYQKIDTGIYNPTDHYLGAWNRQQCLDEMIRNSNSPCAERWMAELGKAAIQNMINSYGLTGTSMASLTASPADVSTLLKRLQAGEDLSSNSTRLFMDSMLGQNYRNGLPKGFAPWQVYDKVGFSEYNEYHDAGIITLPNGDRLLIVVMTNNASSRLIAQLASQIMHELQ